MAFVILDRDGVINYESNEYIKSPEEWHPIPGSLQAVADLNQAGFKILIATNQSGVGRGYYDLATLNRIHEKMLQAIKAQGGEIMEIFFCPHHPDDGCLCRKPKIGLLEAMQKKYELNLSQTFFIGDSYVDVKAAKEANCKPLLVLTGNGKQCLERYPMLQTIPHFPDLASAVPYVISQR